MPRNRVAAFLFLLLCGPVLAQGHRVPDLRRWIEGDNRNNPVASVRWAEEGLPLVQGGADPRAEIAFLLALIRDLAVLNEQARASAYVERARPLVARYGGLPEQFQLETGIAALWVAQERYPECRSLLEALLPRMEAHLARSPGDLEVQRALAQAWRLLGVAQGRLGHLTEAIRALTRAQMQCERLGDARGQGLVLNRMSRMYVQMGRLEEAERADLQAIALAEALGDGDLQATFRLELSNAYATQKDPVRQLAELKKAGALAAKAQDATLMRRVAVNLADACLGIRDYRAALGHADRALALSLEAKDPFSTALCRINRGIALNRLGSGPEGLAAIQEGLDHFRDAQDQGHTAEITAILSEEYVFAGDYRRAYETRLAFEALNDAFLKREDQKRIAEATAAFESDKKQFQIDALERDRRNQARLRLLWIAIGLLGAATTLGLVLGRKKLQQANRALAEMSLRDPLTSLANRRYLTTRIDEDLAQLHRLHRDLPAAGAQARVNLDVVFLMIDIDHFKHVNDQFGHGAGDCVLRQFAALLTESMRDSDTVVRWGGEEFFVVAKHTAKAEAHLVAERIRARVAGFPFDLGQGGTLARTCSIGFASFPFFGDGAPRFPWEKVVELADQCLYAAKANGRDTWVGVHADAAFAPGTPIPVLLEGGLCHVESRLEAPIVWPGAPRS